MSQTATERPARRRRWIWIVLTISLAVNALLVGVMARAIWQMRAGAIVAGARVETALPAFISSLPADRRDVLRKDVPGNRRDEMRSLRLSLRQARSDAIQAFLAEPFDKGKFVAAEDRLLEAELAVRRATRSFLPEIAEHMTSEERSAYLRWRGHWRMMRGYRGREDGGRGWWWRRRGGPDDGDPGNERNEGR
jgi:uncharacterized membrane protein